MHKTVLIIGATGFIGGALTRYYSRFGTLVYGVGSELRAPSELTKADSYFQIRLPDAAFDQLIERIRPDLVIHCAGNSSVPSSIANPRKDFFNGPVLTWEILDSIRRNAPGCKFLFLSSAAVYGCPVKLPIKESHPVDPISPYGVHKLQSEAICLEFSSLFDVPTASARIFSAYGPGLRRQVFWDLCQQGILEGRILAQGTGNESRDFIHIEDLCTAIAICCEKSPFVGEVYNMGSGFETRISDLARSISQQLGGGCEVEFTGHVSAGTPLNWRADISTIKEMGFSPAMSVESSLSDYVEWCRHELSKVKP